MQSRTQEEWMLLCHHLTILQPVTDSDWTNSAQFYAILVKFPHLFQLRGSHLHNSHTILLQIQPYYKTSSLPGCATALSGKFSIPSSHGLFLVQLEPENRLLLIT